jgi:pectin methylesterase-like acyl-CoA thioesterase
VLNPRAIVAFILVAGSISLGVLGFAATSVNPNKIPSRIAPATNSAPGWSAVTAPNVTQQQFLGTTCVSSTDCWAVGFY